MVICLEQGSDCLHMVQLMPLHPKTPSSLASFKSRLVLPFWYRLTQFVLQKGPLNGCSSSSSCCCCIFQSIKHSFVYTMSRFTASIAALEQVLPKHSRSSRKVFWATEPCSRPLEMLLQLLPVVLLSSLWALAESNSFYIFSVFWYTPVNVSTSMQTVKLCSTEIT